MDKNKSSYVLFVIAFLGFAGQLSAMFTAKQPYAINKRVEKLSPEVRKKIDEVLQKKYLGGVIVQLYDLSSKSEYVLIKKLWETSVLLESFVVDMKSSQNDAPYLKIPFDYLFDMIPNLFKLIRFYLETNKKERKDKLQEQIKSIDFKTLVSIVLLANHLLIKEDILNEILEGFRNRIISLDGINQSCFAELQGMDKVLKKQILTAEVWDAFLQQMKIPIARYCFNQRFISSISNPYIPQFSRNVARKLLLNADGSRLLYVVAGDKANLNYLYTMNLQTFNVSSVSKIIRQYPSWINENIFIYLDPFGAKNKLLLYDCEKNSEIEEIIYPPGHKYYMDLNIHDLISASDKQNKQKIILLYSLYSSEDKTVEYGLFFYNHENGKTDYKELMVGIEKIKLLCYSNEKVTFLIFEEQIYGYEEYIVNLYELPIKDDTFGDLIIHNKAEVVSKSIKKYGFSQCVVSPDGSKIAFLDDQSICIQLLATFSQPWIKLPSKKPISTLVFSEDSQMLMVGSEDGTIDAFDSNNGIKIGELLYAKKQAFEYNNALSFSSDGATFAISGRSSKDALVSDNLLIWQLMPDWQIIRDRYVGLLNRWRDDSSLEKIVLCKLICDQSREEKKELDFSDQGKQEFHQLDYEIQEMLTNIGYVASENLVILPAQQDSISELVTPIQQSQSLEPSFLERMKAAAITYWQQLMGNKNRYVNE